MNKKLVGLVRVSEDVAGLAVDPVWTSGAAVADRRELPVVAVLAVDVLKRNKFYFKAFQMKTKKVIQNLNPKLPGPTINRFSLNNLDYLKMKEKIGRNIDGYD